MNLLPELRGFFTHALRHPKVKRASMAAAGFLALDLAVFLFFFLPFGFRHHQLKGGIEAYRDAQWEKDKAEENAKNFALVSQRTKTLEKQLGTRETQASLVGLLSRLASKNGLKVVSQDFSSKEGSGPDQTLTQDLTLQGSYPSLRSFLMGLESLPVLTVVEQAHIERLGEGNGHVRAVLRLTTFHRSAGEGAAS